MWNAIRGPVIWSAAIALLHVGYLLLAQWPIYRQDLSSASPTILNADFHQLSLFAGLVFAAVFVLLCMYRSRYMNRRAFTGVVICAATIGTLWGAMTLYLRIDQHPDELYASYQTDAVDYLYLSLAFYLQFLTCFVVTAVPVLLCFVAAGRDQATANHSAEISSTGQKS
jgi:glucan phosphoethanolaminetransferase (alkaline phosphatase superfamily)